MSVPGLANPLRIPELLLQEFFYISLANVKVHPYERFTGTLKNALGLLPQADISSYHVQLPELIAALYRLCTPDLAILDGRIGLEGKGPIIGQARRLGKIVLGRDGLAVDACGCRLIGMSPDDVPHLAGLPGLRILTWARLSWKDSSTRSSLSLTRRIATTPFSQSSLFDGSIESWSNGACARRNGAFVLGRTRGCLRGKLGSA